MGQLVQNQFYFSTDGSVIASHGIEYPLYSPTPETAEQDPEEIFRAVINTIKETVRLSSVQPSDILCVSLVRQCIVSLP